ncbi:MAG: RNA polymerase-binding transcription factor DksA [uncultured Nocardioides sp.]|uniref:RNA polymerase-binding transcription factor DksA n=1 Tax=uncultured Nocardioides sp. TaxID=198441 RepID=A0A6J4NKS5_9ACTN|nr:MAG: RNA polymerase-binding transcription factor DksA [uncultured Nocardioides sp.]
MARTTPKSLAGSAADAAKKVIGRASAAPDAASSAPKKKSAANGTATTAGAEATTAKTTTAKKTSAATKAPVKKTTTKTTAVKAPAVTTAVKKAPAAKKTPVKRSSVAANGPVTTTSATTTSVTTAPAQTTPVKKVPVAKSAPTKSSAKTASSSKDAPATKVPKKALASSLVVKEGEESWTKAELDEVVAELHGQHDKLAHVIEDAEAELAGLMKDAGDGAGHDQADMGATSFERDHELTVVNIERDMVAQIDKALARIDDGTYGVCEACGEPIGKMRLMAFPRATLCLPCKQREERR